MHGLACASLGRVNQEAGFRKQELAADPDCQSARVRACVRVAAPQLASPRDAVATD